MLDHLSTTDDQYTALQRQKSVSAYSQSKQILPSDFARQTALQKQKTVSPHL